MQGLKFRVDCPYFAAFRVPTTTSVILTYSIPPYTTIRGMISNALGLRRDDLQIQDWFKIGIKPLNFEKGREMAKLLKLKGTGKNLQRTFPSSPMFREFLVEPSYEIFLAGEEDKIQNVRQALSNPERPLYLGSSDDHVEVKVSETVEVREDESDEISSVVEGIYGDCIVEKVPYRFLKSGKTYSVEYKVVSIPIKEPINLVNTRNAFNFGGRQIVWMC